MWFYERNKMDTTDLEYILSEVKEEIPTAAIAKERSENSVPNFAKIVLKDLNKKISAQISHNRMNLSTTVQVEIDSPVLSLIIATLRKLGYKVRPDESNDGTQLTIDWS
jgi:hypothetical protein